MNKFDKLYSKIILEWRPPQTCHGKSGYAMDITHAIPVYKENGKEPWGINPNGSTVQALNRDGDMVDMAWRIIVSDYKHMTNFLTGEKIKNAYTPAFIIKGYDGRNYCIQIPIDDWKKAYDDEKAAIERGEDVSSPDTPANKLRNMGLTPDIVIKY